MPTRTTRDYEGPSIAPKIQAVLDAALEDEGDIDIDDRYVINSDLDSDKDSDMYSDMDSGMDSWFSTLGPATRKARSQILALLAGTKTLAEKTRTNMKFKMLFSLINYPTDRRGFVSIQITLYNIV